MLLIVQLKIFCATKFTLFFLVDPTNRGLQCMLTVKTLKYLYEPWR